MVFLSSSEGFNCSTTEEKEEDVIESPLAVPKEKAITKQVYVR
tara:strand:- start:98 stop:226 length:129 start_codon:yes stop_codon:yes gene_type:complete